MGEMAKMGLDSTIDLVALRLLKTGVGSITAGTLFRAFPKEAEKYITAGDAVKHSDYLMQKWNGFRWDGCEVAVLASGESMNKELADRIQKWRDQDTALRKAIVVNTTFRLALWADVLYACDGPWWDYRRDKNTKSYYEEAKESFKGTFWTQDAVVATKYGLNFISSRRNNGLSDVVGLINQGENSGYQAIGLAHQAGAAKVYLFGFDMKGGHWHGDHPSTLKKPNYYDRWTVFFNRMAVDCKRVGFEVINCTQGSALKCFPTEDHNKVLEINDEKEQEDTLSAPIPVSESVSIGAQ